MLKLPDSKHAGSALLVSALVRTQRYKRWSINPSGKPSEDGSRAAHQRSFKLPDYALTPLLCEFANLLDDITLLAGSQLRINRQRKRLAGRSFGLRKVAFLIAQIAKTFL